MVRLGELVMILDLHRQGLCLSAIARETGIGVHNIYSIFCQLRHLENVGGRRTSREAIDREHEEAAEMATLEACGRCGLRDDHVGVGDRAEAGNRRGAPADHRGDHGCSPGARRPLQPRRRELGFFARFPSANDLSFPS